MKVLLLVLGIFCLVYYFLCVSFAGFGAAQIFIWPLVSFGCFLVCVILYCCEKHGFVFPLWSKLAAGVILILVAGLFLWGESLILSGMLQKGEPDLEYVIVLGAKVKGERPSKALRERLDHAAEYLNENPDTKAILSGGQGDGEEITEAECMFRYLTGKGIDESRLIKEEHSTSTWENLKFSFELVNKPEARVGVLTHNYHVYRGMLLAERVGFENVCGIAAPSESVMQLHYLVRECAAVLKERLF